MKNEENTHFLNEVLLMILASYGMSSGNGILVCFSNILTYMLDIGPGRPMHPLKHIGSTVM